jgi:hypothetical protein
MTLPLLFKTTVDRVPADVPYLHPDPALTTLWKNRLHSDPPGLRVGLCWAGTPKHAHDRLRSLNPQLLSPLARVPNVAFYSLQKDSPTPTIPGLPLIDHTLHLSDFSHTAALIQNLDLVISVDTAIAHLSGALAKPTWLMLPIGPDFRWLKDRPDSPWYPTLKLFRQSTLLDWPPVIEQIATELIPLAQH